MKKRIALLLGTALGAGYFPKAPGTAGSLVAIPLAWWSLSWSDPARLGFWAALFLIGVWAAREIDLLTGQGDSQIIVLDEVVGMGITSWIASPAVADWIAVFILFRFFDMLKIPPVRQLDRWSKKMATRDSGGASSWWGGFGVMADDVLAGFQGLLVMILLKKLHFLA